MPLVLDDLQAEESEAASVLSMRVAGGGRLLLRRHGAALAGIDVSGTPFLALATLLASAQGRDVVIDADVDELATANARIKGELLRSWFGWHAPQISTAGSTPLVAPVQAVGLFFSRGLDSMCTLIEQRGRIGVLLGMDWQDPPYGTDGTAEIWRGTAAAAADAALPLVRLSTNARTFLDPVLPWEMSYGHVLGALAQLASPAAGEAIVSASYPAGVEKPHGSHPDLDPLWSSSRLRVSYAPGPGGRNEKAALVGRDRFAARWLKICWERAGDGNCGRCAKCLMTMTNFRIAGFGDAVADRFDGTLSPEAVLAVADSPMVSPANVTSVLDALAMDDPLREPWLQVRRRALERHPLLQGQAAAGASAAGAP